MACGLCALVEVMMVNKTCAHKNWHECLLASSGPYRAYPDNAEKNAECTGGAGAW
jgi:hypothetical protein